MLLGEKKRKKRNKKSENKVEATFINICKMNETKGERRTRTALIDVTLEICREKSL
jgi:hypothetical protein